MLARANLSAYKVSRARLFGEMQFEIARTKSSAKLLELLSFDSILSDIHHARAWLRERDTGAREL